MENVCISEKTKKLPISQALSAQVYQSQPFPIPCCKGPALVKFLASEEKQTRTHLSLGEAEAASSPQAHRERLSKRTRDKHDSFQKKERQDTNPKQRSAASRQRGKHLYKNCCRNKAEVSYHGRERQKNLESPTLRFRI